MTERRALSKRKKVCGGVVKYYMREEGKDLIVKLKNLFIKGYLCFWSTFNGISVLKSEK